MLLDDDGQSLTRFFRKLTTLRRAYPILRRERFLIGEYNDSLGVKDVTWINTNGLEMQDHEWSNALTRCFGMLMDGRAQVTGIRKRGHDATLLLVINGYADLVNFILPECPGGTVWSGLLDTNAPDETLQQYGFGATYQVTGRSLLLFLLADNPIGEQAVLPAPVNAPETVADAVAIGKPLHPLEPFKTDVDALEAA